MEHKEAASLRMPFGKHRGKTLDEIGSTDEGLRYLDWAAGEFRDGYLKMAISVYLEDPSIARDLAELVGEED